VVQRFLVTAVEHVMADRARPFVGRERELATLQDTLEQVRVGHGSVTTVAGEPGIGKTRLIQEFELYAQTRGATVHWGRTPETSARAAYWPWIRALRSLISELNLTLLEPVIQRYAGDLVRLFPEVRQIVPDVPEPAARGDAGDQLRLFDAIATFLREAAALQPFVLVLEDVHWADRASLQLLQYVSAELSSASLLLLITYRNFEVVPGSALEATLAGLTRLHNNRTIELRGLTEPEIRRYIRLATGEEPSDSAVRQFTDRTEGNPLFLREMVTLDDSSRLPASIKTLVAARLAQLSVGCQDLLQAAAVAGPSFRFELLAALSPDGREAALSRVEHALAGGILDEAGRSGSYRFHHALVQEALITQLSTTRKAQLHARIAEVLEAMHGDRPERAAELAYHFGQAATVDATNASRAVRHAKDAAEHAERQFAWDNAVALYGSCLELLAEAGDVPGIDAVDLLLGRARSLHSTENAFAAGQAAHRALELLTARGDGTRVAKALEFLWSFALPADTGEQLVGAALQGLSDAEPALRARVLAQSAARVKAQTATAKAWLAEAEHLAAEHQLRDVEAAILEAKAMSSGDLGQNVRFFRQAARLYDAVGDHAAAARCLASLAGATSMLGHVPDIIAVADEVEDHARLVHHGSALFQVFNLRVGLARGRGDLDYIAEGAGHERMGSFLANLAVNAIMRGDLDYALELTENRRWPSGYEAQRIGYSAWVEAERAQLESARKHWGQFERILATRWRDIQFIQRVTLAQPNVMPLFRDEACEVLASAAPQARNVLGHSADCARGLAALNLRRVDDAQKHFRVGLEWAMEQEFPIQAGRNLLGLAQVAESRGDIATARDHVERAFPLFERCRAGLYLNHAREMKERLAALSTTTSRTFPDGLSEREVEVLRLVASGRSNPQIAGVLVISRATVARHVSNILTKTGLSNRTELAAYALANGLIQV
jgi:DNA-binding CsgD family transcriptional regulator